jgi:uncharacterized low-complexity protein
MKMSDKKILKPLSLAVGVALAASVAPTTAGADEDGLFNLTNLSGAYMVRAIDDTDAEGSCGEGRCGGDADAEGSCGGDGDAEGSCGGDGDAEGSCGGDTDAEGSCGGDSDAEGSCGGDAESGGDADAEASCGGSI